MPPISPDVVPSSYVLFREPPSNFHHVRARLRAFSTLSPALSGRPRRSLRFRPRLRFLSRRRGRRPPPSDPRSPRASARPSAHSRHLARLPPVAVAHVATRRRFSPRYAERRDATRRAPHCHGSRRVESSCARPSVAAAATAATTPSRSRCCCCPTLLLALNSRRVRRRCEPRLFLFLSLSVPLLPRHVSSLLFAPFICLVDDGGGAEGMTADQRVAVNSA